MKLFLFWLTFSYYLIRLFCSLQNFFAIFPTQSPENIFLKLGQDFFANESHSFSFNFSFFGNANILFLNNDENLYKQALFLINSQIKLSFSNITFEIGHFSADLNQNIFLLEENASLYLSVLK